MTMRENLKAAVVGATGVLGAELLAILSEQEWSFETLELFASRESAGEFYQYGGSEFEIVELTDYKTLQNFDCVFLCVPPEILIELEPIFDSSRQLVIDVTGSGFKSANARSILAGVDLDDDPAPGQFGLFFNPNPITCQLAPILCKVHKKVQITNIVASTYQSVSDAGKLALDELWDQTRSVFTQKHASQDAFHHQIAFNCIPQIDTFLEDGSTRVEKKIADQIRSNLKAPELPISITCVRVPVFHSHCVSLYIETVSSFDQGDFNMVVESLPYVQLANHPEEFPMPVGVTSSDEIFIGRVRSSTTPRHSLALWIVADNLRRGAVINAIEILKQCTEYRHH